MFTKKIIIDYFADKPSKLRHSTGGHWSFCSGVHLGTVWQRLPNDFLNISFTTSTGVVYRSINLRLPDTGNRV